MKNKFVIQKLVFFLGTAIALSVVACGKGGSSSATAVTPLTCTSCPAGMTGTLRSVIGRNYTLQNTERFQIGMQMYGNAGSVYGSYSGQVAAQGVLYASQYMTCNGNLIANGGQMLSLTTVQPGNINTYSNVFSGLLMQLQGTPYQFYFPSNTITPANSTSNQIGYDGRHYDLVVLGQVQVLVNGNNTGCSFYVEDGFGT